MKKTILFSVAMFYIAFFGKAQLKYDNSWPNLKGALSFNGPAYRLPFGIDASTTWTGGYHVWTNGSFDIYLSTIEFDIMSNIAKISSNTGSIWFWGSWYGWNDIYAGNIVGVDFYGNNYYTLSDISAKTNIANVRNATQTLLALRPVTYQWIDTERTKNRKTSSLATNPKEIGFIAQEIEQVLPDIIAFDDDGQKLVNYQALIPLLTGAIQELNARIEVLEQQLNAK